MEDNDRIQVLGEVLMDELRTIREYVSDIPEMKTDIQELKVGLDEANRKLDVTMLTVGKHSEHIQNHETRISDLEEKAG